MTLNTAIPIATHIQNINMWSSKTSLLISVMPRFIFKSSQPAFKGLEKRKSAKTIFCEKFFKNLSDIFFYPMKVLNKIKPTDNVL